MNARVVSERAILVETGEREDVAAAAREAHALGRRLENAAIPGVSETVTGAASVLIVFGEPLENETDALTLVSAVASRPGEAPGPEPRTFAFDVVYDGPDLKGVARRTGLTETEVVERHAGASYRVAFVGFAPGFPYLVGLPRELEVPRLPAPRPRVPHGSVAVAGPFSGIYPRETPGGWHLLGRTDATLFDATVDSPALLRAGDHVRFRPR